MASFCTDFWDIVATYWLEKIAKQYNIAFYKSICKKIVNFSAIY